MAFEDIPLQKVLMDILLQRAGSLVVAFEGIPIQRADSSAVVFVVAFADNPIQMVLMDIDLHTNLADPAVEIMTS